MGANAQTTVPTFTAGQVLTAAQMNDSARTGVPVFADTSARDAGFGGTGEKTLAEGQLCYLEDSNVVQYYDGSLWATLGPSAASGLELISTTTIGSAVASVTVTGAFSSTYDNYLVTISGGAASTGMYMFMQLGATTTGYKYGGGNTGFSGGPTFNADASNAYTAFPYVGGGNANGLFGFTFLNSPNLAKYSRAFGWLVSDTFGGFGGSVLEDTTQYTAFTLTPNTGTMTGGEIRVYGLKN